MSLPLLLERTIAGRGPIVPVKDEYDTLIVEGLAPDCSVYVDLGNSKACFKEDGRFPVTKTAKGTVAQAQLNGCGAKVHVWLEKTNG